VPFTFFQNLVGTALALVFDVENGIDEVFLFEWPEAIFPANAGEDRAVAEGG
jgi:hypothetical protein